MVISQQTPCQITKSTVIIPKEPGWAEHMMEIEELDTIILGVAGHGLHATPIHPSDVTGAIELDAVGYNTRQNVGQVLARISTGNCHPKMQLLMDGLLGLVEFGKRIMKHEVWGLFFHQLMENLRPQIMLRARLH